ncbi:23463_t:CDS:2, partial [Racocetra persica]
MIDLPDDHYDPLDRALILRSDITNIKKDDDNNALNDFNNISNVEVHNNIDALSDNDTFNSDDNISSNVDEFVNHDYTITPSSTLTKTNNQIQKDTISNRTASLESITVSNSKENSPIYYNPT